MSSALTPWPFTAREILMDVIAVDDIDAHGFIIAKMRTLETDTPPEDLPEGFTLPEMDDDVERIEFDGAFLFRKCPIDHPSYAEARKKTKEDLVLLQFTMFFDAHMTMVPKSFINFITRSVIGMVWGKFLRAAEQVRDGSLVQHKKVIDGKSEFYDWVRKRSTVMLKETKGPRNKAENVKKNEIEEEGDDRSWTMEEVLKIAC